MHRSDDPVQARARKKKDAIRREYRSLKRHGSPAPNLSDLMTPKQSQRRLSLSSTRHTPLPLYSSPRPLLTYFECQECLILRGSLGRIEQEYVEDVEYKARCIHCRYRAIEERVSKNNFGSTFNSSL